MKSNKVNINNKVGKKEKLSNYKKIFWSRKRIFSWNMVSPAFISLLLLAIGPLIFIFYNAFRRWNLTVPVPPKFIGFSNFITLFHDGRFLVE